MNSQGSQARWEAIEDPSWERQDALVGKVPVNKKNITCMYIRMHLFIENNGICHDFSFVHNEG